MLIFSILFDIQVELSSSKLILEIKAEPNQWIDGIWSNGTW